MKYSIVYRHINYHLKSYLMGAALVVASQIHAAEIESVDINMNAIIGEASGITTLQIEPIGQISETNQKLLSKFRDYLILQAAGLKFQERVVTVAAQPDHPLHITINFGEKQGDYLDQQIWGCTGAWLNSLDGASQLEVSAYMLTPTEAQGSDANPDAAKQLLLQYGSKLREFVAQHSPLCKSFDTQTKTEWAVSRRLQKYLQTKVAGRVLQNPDLQGVSWLVDELYEEKNASVGKELHAAEVAAIRSWMDGLKSTAAMPTNFTLELPKTLQNLELSGSMGASHFTLSALGEMVPSADLVCAIDKEDSAQLNAWATLLDTMIEACVDSTGKVTSTLCNKDNFTAHFRWINVKRSSGDFKFLRTVL